jgi:hypothetical protein
MKKLALNKTVLILFTIGLMVAAAGCTSSDGSGVKDVKPSENTPAASENTGAAPAATPEATPAKTPEVKGSFNNPASIGETIVLTSTGLTYDVSIIDSIRGDKANHLVKSANQFNEEPAAGYEYLFVKTKVTYAEGKKPDDINYLYFKAYAAGVETQQPSIVYPNDYVKLASGNVMPGATKEGWIAFTVPKDQEIVIAFQPNMFDESTAYISLKTK